MSAESEGSLGILRRFSSQRATQTGVLGSPTQKEAPSDHTAMFPNASEMLLYQIHVFKIQSIWFA